MKQYIAFTVKIQQVYSPKKPDTDKYAVVQQVHQQQHAKTMTGLDQDPSVIQVITEYSYGTQPWISSDRLRSDVPPPKPREYLGMWKYEL